MNHRILRWGGAAAGLLAALFAGWMMYLRNSEEKLWGNWTLVFALGLLLAGLFLFARPWWGDAVRRKRMGWALAGGLMAGLAFLPGWYLQPLIAFAFVPLLLLERESRAGAHPDRLFKYLFPAFLLWNLISTYWIANSSLPAGVFAFLANSLLMCLPWLLHRAAVRKMPRLGFAPLIVFWLAFEYLHHRWELHWPWLTLGNVWAPAPAFVQWYAYTGVLGGSLLVLLLNTSQVAFWEHWRAEGRPDFRKLTSFLALNILFGLGAVVFSGKGPAPSETATVVLVQPGYEPFYEKPATPEDRQMDRIIELAAPLMDEDVDFLVLPETSFGFVDLDFPERNPEFIRLTNFLIRFPNTRLLAGVDAYRQLAPEEPGGRATRYNLDAAGDTIRYEIYNAAIFWPGSMGRLEVYKKSKLVPGPEQFPYPRLLSFLKPVMDRFGGTMSGVGSQQERTVFTGSAARVAPIICYESVFGSFLTDYVWNGADLFVMMTNDGWWDRTPGHRQHFNYARLRAIETSRAVARAANTGISGFIDPSGRATQMTAYGTAAAIRAEVPIGTEITFYVQWRDIIGRFALFIAALFLLNIFVKRLTPDS